MARKTKEEAAITHSQLLDAAEEVFFIKGYSKTTLMDVANYAKLTRGAIYWHFKNKIELFEAMVERVRLPLESLTEAYTDENEENPLGKLHDFSVKILKQAATDVHYQRVYSIIMHKFEYNGEVAQIEARTKSAFFNCRERIERTFNNAITRGQLHKDLDIKQAAITKQAYFNGIISNWLFAPETFNLATMSESLVENYFYMLSHSPHIHLKKEQI